MVKKTSLQVNWFCLLQMLLYIGCLLHHWGYTSFQQCSKTDLSSLALLTVRQHQNEFLIVDLANKHVLTIGLYSRAEGTWFMICLVIIKIRYASELVNLADLEVGLLYWRVVKFILLFLSNLNKPSLTPLHWTCKSLNIWLSHLTVFFNSSNRGLKLCFMLLSHP